MAATPRPSEKFQAHQQHAARDQSRSPVNRANLPKTCGSCHTGPFVSFQKSQHYNSLLAAGDDCWPTCSTCHGEAGAYLLAGVALESVLEMPRTGPASGTDGRAAEAQMLMKDVRAVRAQLNEAQSIIRRVKDKTVRARFEEMYRQAEYG